MNTIDIVRVVAIVVAFAGAASKLLTATKGFWDTFPAWAQRVLPGAVLVLGDLPAALSGVQTWTDFGVAILGALALGLPGKHVQSGQPDPLPEKSSIGKIPPLALLCLALAVLLSCSSAPPKTDDAVRALRATCAALAEDDARAIPPSWGGSSGMGGAVPVGAGAGGAA